jgi:hypothetical protein
VSWLKTSYDIGKGIVGLFDKTKERTEAEVDAKVREMNANYGLIGESFCGVIADLYRTTSRVGEETANDDIRAYATHVVGELKRVWQCECVSFNSEGSGKAVTCPATPKEPWCDVPQTSACDWVENYGSWEKGYRVAVYRYLQEQETTMPTILICRTVTVADFTELELTANLITGNDETFANWKAGCMEGQFQAMSYMFSARSSGSYARQHPDPRIFVPGQVPGMSVVPPGRYASPPSKYQLPLVYAFSEGARVGIQKAVGKPLPETPTYRQRLVYNFKCSEAASVISRDLARARQAGLVVAGDKVDEALLEAWEKGCEDGASRVRLDDIRKPMVYIGMNDQVRSDRPADFAIYNWETARSDVVKKYKDED